jgi:type II secretory pathway component GspD/PulD (secretin)
MRSFLAAMLVLCVAQPASSQPWGKKRPRAVETCKKPPAKAIIKLNFKPDTEVADVIVWYASLFCTTMLFSSSTPLAGKKVTIISPTPVKVAEAQRLFFAALDSVGLTVEREGKALRVIDAAHARGSAIPVIPAPP